MEQHPNFFRLYHDYTKLSEPPPNFHAWSAIAVISALLGKKCFMPQGLFTVFPNLYVILVGDPGTRKSTAMNVAKRLTKLVERVPIAPESSTREALIDDMAKNKVTWEMDGKDISYWQSSAFVGELEQFFGGKHINSQMVGFLTAIWDEPEFKERTRKGGEVKIRNPYFSLLGCCTPGWMNDKLKNDVISDGFSRRGIFVLEKNLNCSNPDPVITPEEEAALVLLEKEVQRIFLVAGRFSYTTEARFLWIAEYNKIREEAKHYSTKVQHYFSSKHILAQKIAMCLSAATRNDRIIDSIVLRAAFEFLGETEKTLDEVFSGVGRNELKAQADKVYQHIAKTEETGLTKGQLLGMCYGDVNTQELDEILNALTGQNLVKLTSQSAAEAPRYRVGKVTKQAQARNLLELGGRIVPTSERPTSQHLVSAVKHLVDPTTERLLIRQQQQEALQLRGKLFQGKMRELLGQHD